MSSPDGVPAAVNGTLFLQTSTHLFCVSARAAIIPLRVVAPSRGLSGVHSL
jgi:hypothetical protein